MRAYFIQRHGDSQPSVQLPALFEEFVATLAACADEKDGWIRHNVERHVLTNVFMVAALLDDEDCLGVDVEARCRELVQMLLDNSVRKDGCGNVPLSYLVRAVLDYAIARFSSPSTTVRSEIAGRMARDGKDMGRYTTHYDKERFAVLTRLTNRSLMIR